MVGIVAEMPIIDRDFSNGPVIAACHREILCRRGPSHKQRRCAERSKHRISHCVSLPLNRKPERFGSYGNGVAKLANAYGGVVPRAL
jgi:hypothetical protein